MALRCVYTDLDGTLLGSGASFLRDAGGSFTLLAARALEACFRAGVEVVPKSGRRRDMLHEDARLLGFDSYIYETGSGMVIDGEDTLLTGDLQPRDGKTVHQLIEESGAPRLLLESFPGRLEYHSPWHERRSVTHLLRGVVDLPEATARLEENGLGHLHLVDNGEVRPRPGLPSPPHAYHLLPRASSKLNAVTAHMRARGYEREECIAVGDSAEDIAVADVVDRFFLVANAGPEARAAIAGRPNVEITGESHGEGFYEAVVRSLAEA